MGEAMKKVEDEPCKCVHCSFCDGSGNLWVDLGGEFHKHRLDDLGDLETCDECSGSGIIETCDRCQLLEEMSHD